ncbi:MAG: YitT family protein [Clostridia bacterium]|nr:YitT family protein [Clostridia bacterium]MBR6753353.1 YitT family protein [Clostridia bacterium]
MKLKKVKEFLQITLGATIVAVAVYFFMLPSHVSVGSATALAMMLNTVIPLPVSAINLIMNVGLLVVGYLIIGPEFGIKTVYASILMPLVMGLLEVIFPNFQSITQDPLLDVICYILVVGVGLSLLFSCNASSGGLDIVAKILNKYQRMDLGKAMGLAGMLIAALSAFFYEPKIVVISLIGTYFSGMLVDHFIFGMNIKRRVCILSEKLDDIVQFILHDLHSGATLYEATGAYNGEKRREAVVIVDKMEYRLLMEYLKKTDPKAFVTVIAVNEIHYTPKK